MNEFTKNRLFKEAQDLLLRAQSLLIAARKKHEQEMARRKQAAA